MAKNGKKAFWIFFKVDESSDEYEDDLFEDDEYDDDDEEDSKRIMFQRPKAVNGRASSFTAASQTAAQPAKNRNLQKLPEHQLQHHQAIQNLYLLTTEAREVPSRYLLLNQMNLMMPR